MSLHWCLLAEWARNLDDAVRGLRANTVKRIGLRHNNIGDPGAIALADAVKHNKSVKEISLYGNRIGDPGATALADAVKHNKSVETIDLDNNNIGDPGATALADALKHNKSVTYINLEYNGIGDPGATALADALKHNKSVERINLIFNNIGDPGATALAEAVKHNKSVEYISLGDNNISPTVLQAVEDAIKHNPFFLLELDCANLRAADVPAFRFVRFILFLGAGIGTKYDEAPEDDVGVLLDPLPPEVWLHILSFSRLSELQFAAGGSAKRMRQLLPERERAKKARGEAKR